MICSQPVKILHVADYLPDLHRIAGGAEHAARRSIEEQARAGLDVEVVTLPADSTCDTAPWQRRFEMRNIDRMAPRLAYAVKQLYLPADPLAARDLARALRASRPDVVHYHNLHYAGLSVASVARSAGIPSVWTIYDYWLFCPSFMLLTNRGELCTVGHSEKCVDCIGTRRLRALKPLKRMLFGTRPAAFARPAAAVDRFVVLSEASRDLLTRHGIEPARIAVIPQYGWNEAFASVADAPPERGRLLYVGWIEPRKGLHVVVRALALAAREFPELHLEVLGMAADARYREGLEEFIRAQGLAGRVRFRDRVGRAEVLRELQSAYLVTIPEQWENMSPVILTEAMAAGACVLASRVGGVPQFVDDFETGLMAVRDSPEDFAAKMRWAMHHPQEVLAIRSAARARARELFDTGEINRRTMALYASVTGRGS
jgi:glycosyltransferase involved in cell wall biosynthesis